MVFVLPKFLGAVSPLAVMSVKISVISEYKYFSPPINKYPVVTNARGGVNLRKVWMKRGVGAIRVCGTPRGRVGHPGVVWDTISFPRGGVSAFYFTTPYAQSCKMVNDISV